MIKKSTALYGKFTSTDRLMSHWKQRRQAAGRSRARSRNRDAEKLVDPDFDDFCVEDLLADFGLGRDRDADGS